MICICDQNNHFTWKYRRVGCSLVELLIQSVKVEPINRIFFVLFVSKVAQVQCCISSILKFRSDRANDKSHQDLNTKYPLWKWVFIRLILQQLCLWFGFFFFASNLLIYRCKSIHVPQLRMCNLNILLFYTFSTTFAPFHFLQMKKKKRAVTSALSFHDNQMHRLIMSTS